nr:class I SAM-dependent methyltransferase [uncultured Blautia sp.]
MERVLPPGYFKKEDASRVYDDIFGKAFHYFNVSQMSGEVIEFGSYKGYSSRKLAEYSKKYGIDTKITLFDSFEGMPEIKSDVDKKSYQVAAVDDWKKGCFSVPKGIEKVIKADISEIIGEERINIVKGYYQDTLDTVKFSPQSIILVNIDCDLYESITLVLKKLIVETAFQDGAIILFDDYNFNRANPDMGVRKAIRDTFGVSERYVLSTFATYGWHGRAFFIHDREFKVEMRFGEEEKK